MGSEILLWALGTVFIILSVVVAYVKTTNSKRESNRAPPPRTRRPNLAEIRRDSKGVGNE